MPKDKPEIRFAGYTDAWEKRKLTDVVEKQIKGKAQFEKLKAGDVEYLDTSRLNGGKAVLTDGVKDVDQDNILILWDGSKAGTVYTGFEGALGSTLKAYKTSADSQFVYQFLKRYQDNIYNNYRTPNIPHVQKDFLDVFNIEVPIFEEQEKIGILFQNLDHLITVNQRKVDLLKELKKGFLQKMFPKTGEDKPEIRFAGYTDVWEKRPLKKLIKEFSTKSKKENEYKVLSSTNTGMEVRDGRVSGSSNLGYKIIDDGDLVLSPQNLWLGNININNIGTGLVSPSYKTFKFINVSSLFLKPQLRKQRMLEEYKNASTQGASVVRRNLDMNAFYQIEISIPNTFEQKKVGNLFAALDQLITVNQRRVDLLKQEKKALLQKMFV